MARKRGGLAGLYDRNKGVIQAAAPFLAGAVGGPLAGAAIGAAMKGLDREGKSGIGLDLGKAAMGGIAGYGAGAMGKSVAGGLKGRLAGLFTGAQGGGAALPPVDMASKIGMTPGMVGGASAPISVAPASTAGLSTAATPSVFSTAMEKGATRGKSLMSRAESFAKQYPNAIGGAAKLAMAAAGPDNDARKLALMEQQYEDEQAAAGRRAQIAAQLLTGGGAFGRAEPSVVGARYTSMNNRLYGTAPETYAFDPEKEKRNRQFAASIRGAGPMGFPR